jgi:hypothetical protein
MAALSSLSCVKGEGKASQASQVSFALGRKAFRNDTLMTPAREVSRRRGKVSLHRGAMPPLPRWRHRGLARARGVPGWV